MIPFSRIRRSRSAHGVQSVVVYVLMVNSNAVVGRRARYVAVRDNLVRG